MQQLKEKIKHFIHERDWEQYHAPKNLAMALSVEVTELLEIFQWKDTGEELSSEEKQALAREIGDVFIYLLELADKFEIDVVQAAEEKLVLNEKKYPVELVRGKSDKYTMYEKESGEK